MADAKTEMAKLMARRRLEGGEFSYVLKLGGEPLEGKKAAYNKLKELQPEAFAALKTSCQTEGETEEAFDARILKLIPLLPFEEEPKGEDMEVEDGGGQTEMAAEDLYRVVNVKGIDMKKKADEVESHFCREFEGVDKVKRTDGFKKNAKGKNTGKSQGYDITFKEEKFATEFLEKEVKMGETVLKTELLKEMIQTKIMRRQLNFSFSHHLRVLSCIPLEKGEEDRYVLVYSIGRPSQEELEEYFMGLESEFENIVEVKTVLQTRAEVEGVNAKNKFEKLIGILVKFEDHASLVKFTQMKDVKYKEKSIKYYVMSDAVRNNEVRMKKMNFVVDDGPTTQQLADRRIIALRTFEFSPEIESEVKSQFPGVKDVRHCTIDKLMVLTFPTAEAANKAARTFNSQGPVKPLSVVLCNEYLGIREKLLEEEADRLEKTKTKYENIKNSHVTVDGNTIKIRDPTFKPAEKKVAKKEEQKEAKKEATKKEVSEMTVAKPQPTNPIMKKRMNRGSCVFDIYVGVRGFNQHIRNMGKASDMDVCNYFIHNHKDVADVKFVNWTDIVFAKFKTVMAAEQFITLNYHMFYGVELHLHDVPEFLKKKNDQQKDDVSRVLLNKKFNPSMLEGKGVTTNGAGPKASVPKNPEVVLADFSSKQAGEAIRDLFIENLHLDQEVVGQPKWMKGAGDVFKARLTIKLEENAIGYLVKKWNDLEITVEGENVVKAEVSGGNPPPATNGAPKNGASKRGRKRPNNSGNKKAKISLEDY